MCIGVVPGPGGGGGGGNGCVANTGFRWDVGGGGTERDDGVAVLARWDGGGAEPPASRGWPSAPNASESEAESSSFFAGLSTVWSTSSASSASGRGAPSARATTGISEEVRGGALRMTSMLARSGVFASWSTREASLGVARLRLFP
jgi:hypothetical protein